MTEIGPVDYMVVAFPGNQYKGEIAPALADLVEAGTIRIIDLTFVAKNSNGEVMFFELNELDPDVQAAFEKTGVEVNGLFNEDDLRAAAEELAAELVGGSPRLGERLGRESRAGDARRRWRAFGLRALAARVVQAARDAALASA